MNKARAFVTLIRLPNLIFIILTQILAYYFIIHPALVNCNIEPVLSPLRFLLLIISTALIAAAGYMINDYFDIGIDAINKPEKVTIEKIFKRRSVIVWHITLNLLALLLAFSVLYKTLPFRLLGIQILSILLLLFYSTTFKRKLVIGNLVIAVLTALTLLTMALYEPSFHLLALGERAVKLLWMYITFAFVITLIREIIKDIEDVKGDTAQHCETIPLVWGIHTARNIVFALLLVLLVLLLIFLILFLKSHLLLVGFLFIAVWLPLILIFKKVYSASNSVHFHSISSWVKWVTFGGILSMILL